MSLTRGPIYMVNLLKFPPRADYPMGAPLTDRAQAYELYGEAVSECCANSAARWSSKVTQRLMLGEVEELWDKVAIAMYPSWQAMLA
ncbi:MAG: hypothetical protein R3E84_04630 [Pseudomonadales bacterium]